MIQRLRYALLADGGRDRALEPILAWALRRHRPHADLAYLGFERRRGALVGAIATVVARHRPDILFVHRDAERATLTERLAEFPSGAGGIVRVVPVRMTETWLLIDEGAIRGAAGRPTGTTALRLPKVGKLELVRDPKQSLEQALVTASGYGSGRRHDRLLRDRAAFAERVSRLIADFTPLLALPAFRAFDAELRRRLDESPL